MPLAWLRSFLQNVLVRTAISYLYLLRVPLTTILVLLLLPFVSLHNEVSAFLGLDFSPLLRGLFDVDSSGLLILGICTCAVAWTGLTNCWIILREGSRQFGIDWQPSFLSARGYVTGFYLISLPLIVTAFVHSLREESAHFWPLLAGGLGGLLFGSSAAYGVGQSLGLLPELPATNLLIFANPWLVLLWYSRYLSMELHRRTAMKWRIRILKKVDQKGPLPQMEDPQEKLEMHQRLLRQVAASEVPRALYIQLALSSMLVSVFLYLAVGVVARLLFLGNHSPIPTLTYVLLLLMFLCWTFSWLAFRLDRYRIPLLVPLLALSMITSQLSRSDHYYEIVNRVPDAPLSPSEVIRAGKHSTAVLLVAANGGGVQAAAWTARVLSGLEEQCRTTFPADPKIFGDSIRLISAVSGGSVGAMYFANEYDSQGGGLPADGQELENIVSRTETSGLDEIGWALAYVDLWRPLFPVSKYFDRGVALEDAFVRQAGKRGSRLKLGLSSWRDAVRKGWRPDIVFNATVVESGERLLLSTSDSGAGLGKTQFSGARGLYPGKDLAVVTATRLSATFPYVSPAARSNLEGDQFHVVDGGYSDNYGVSTAIEWLDDALRGNGNAIRKVMLVQIHGQPAEGDISVSRHGWFYQGYAPLSAMLNVRNAGQVSHNQRELSLLQRVWSNNNVAIETVVFEYSEPDAPLSWHLSTRERENIQREWERQSHGDAWYKLRSFLATSVH